MEDRKSVCVVVLGDIGRSPRMQYHALSLAQRGCYVDLVGYGNTEPSQELKQESLVLYHYLPDYPNLPLPRFINYVFKTIWQALTLFFVLIMLRPTDSMMVQNPPAIPTLVVCWLVCLFRRTELIIDWHNYAHTIMALSVGKSSLLVKITRLVERIVGKRASLNFCVTNAMKRDLYENWNISATTLYDRPSAIFHPRTLEEKHELFEKLRKEYPEFRAQSGSNGTIFTEINETGGIILKPRRPALLVSSTSWTEDEDFSILLSALEKYEEHCKNGNIRQLPNLICAITGKGPLKQYYSEKIRAFDWKHVAVITPWLESSDYPILLSAADLGVSLHTSSSGLDLPMKVVDMFGCGLTVCAYNFKSLNELIKHNENGFVFDSPNVLSNQIIDYLDNFPNNNSQQSTERKFKEALKPYQTIRWNENWTNVAEKHFVTK